jgi:hypothetical protein
MSVTTNGNAVHKSGANGATIPLDEVDDETLQSGAEGYVGIYRYRQ